MMDIYFILPQSTTALLRLGSLVFKISFVINEDDHDHQKHHNLFQNVSIVHIKGGGSPGQDCIIQISEIYSNN